MVVAILEAEDAPGKVWEATKKTAAAVDTLGSAIWQAKQGNTGPLSAIVNGVSGEARTAYDYVMGMEGTVEEARMIGHALGAIVTSAVVTAAAGGLGRTLVAKSLAKAGGVVRKLYTGAAAAKAAKAGGGGTTTLNRTVMRSELDDIAASGGFRNPPGIEVKYSSSTSEGASSNAKQAAGAFGDGPFTTVRTQIPNSAITPQMRAVVDRGIQTVTVPTSKLNQLSAPEVLNIMSIPF